MRAEIVETKIDPVTGYRLVPLTKLPDDVVNALIQIREQVNESSWQIGEIANRVYEWAIKARGDGVKYDIDKTQIYGMIGRVVGKAGRTVRWYAETERFFRDGIFKDARVKFADLPFVHFSFARRFGGEAGQVLERAAALADEQGYAPSIERLEAEFMDRLRELKAAEGLIGLNENNDSSGGRPQDALGGPREDAGAILIELVQDGVDRLTGVVGVSGAAAEKDVKTPVLSSDPLTSRSKRLEVAERVRVLGEALREALASLEDDHELLRGRRGIGLEREMRELSSRVAGLAKWLRRVS